MISSKNNTDTMVIVLHEIYGINEHIKTVCQHLSKEYNVLCPDLLNGKVFPYSQEEEAYLNFRDNVGFPFIAEQIKEVYYEQKEIYDHIILLGYSIGATLAWLCSEKLRSVDGVIGYYGSRIRDYTELEPKCSTLLLFPEDEKAFDPNELQAELMNKENVTSYILRGIHGFTDPFSANYNAVEAKKAEQMAEAFIRKIAGSPIKT